MTIQFQRGLKKKELETREASWIHILEAEIREILA